MVLFIKSKDKKRLEWKQRDKQPKTLPMGIPIPDGMEGLNLSTGIPYRWSKKFKKWIRKE